MGLSNKLIYEAGSFSHHLNPHRFSQSEILRFYFPALEPCVVWSVPLPSCSSQFISTHMWDLPLHQLPPSPPWSASRCLARSPLHRGCLSLSLLLVWMNVSFLTPWLLDFRTVQFSGSSGCFLFLNLLSFSLCKEAQCVYLCFHLGRKSNFGFNLLLSYK